MVKISALLAEAEARTRAEAEAGGVATVKPYFAFEFFPPRTEEGVNNLKKRFARMVKQGPLYADVTWGAGGSTSDLTMDLAVSMKEAGFEPNMHLTCTNMPIEKLHAALAGAKKAGIENIVALRGDPPKGQEAWTATEGGFACALDLVRFIRREHGDAFCLSVGGYPEGHTAVIKKVDPDALASLSASEKTRVVTAEDGAYVCSDADYAAEIAYLKSKVDAGADFIITQMFFDVDVFLAFVRDCRAAGIVVPILPGIMLIQNYGGFKRMTAFCKTRVPAALRDAVEAVKDDDAALKALGVRVGADMCRALMAAGFFGLHLYTLNMEKVCYGVMRELGVLKDVEGVDTAE